MTVDISHLYIDSSDPIENWSSEFGFLRNDYECDIEFDGAVYPSVEHAFQAAKTPYNAERDVLTDPHVSARDAKKIGRSFQLQHDWDARRIVVMEELIRYKFSEHKDLAEKLIETKNRQLTMVNRGDEFWGVVDTNGGFIGENVLGKILMKVRYDLAETLPITFPSSVSAKPYTMTYPRHQHQGLVDVTRDVSMVVAKPTVVPDVKPQTGLEHRLGNCKVPATLVKELSELYEASKLAADRFGDGDKAVLEIIAGQIGNNPEAYATVVASLGKAVENFNAALKELENG